MFPLRTAVSVHIIISHSPSFLWSIGKRLSVFEAQFNEELTLVLFLRCYILNDSDPHVKILDLFPTRKSTTASVNCVSYTPVSYSIIRSLVSRYSSSKDVAVVQT